MSCENLSIPSPLLASCPTSIFGIPYGTGGRVVANTGFEVQGIILHCYSGTIDELCNEMKCRTKSSIISGSTENSFHYGVGTSGHIRKHVEPCDISWAFGAYKNNSYVDVPPPNTPINWPTLQAANGLNTTPDVYVINVAIALGHQVLDATGCYQCPTASGLPQDQHDELVQLLAYLVQEYEITIDSEHITFHDLIRCDETQMCPCTDIGTLLSEVAAFCPPCEGDEAPAAPIADGTDTINYVMGITEACCPGSPGCYVKVPWDGCIFGDLANDGDLGSYILGLTQDPVTEQWCLTRGCLALDGPLIGCGTVDDPLRMDLCTWGDYIPDQAADTMINLVGLDDAGCLIESSAADVIALYETPITPIDTATVDLTVSGTSDHTLQADVKVSAEVNNQVEIRPDGLFVDFTCIDFVDAYPEEPVIRILGQNDLNECVHQTSQSLVEDAICAVPEDMAAEPTWLLGKTDAECPVFVTPGSIVAAGLTVSDGFCVHMNYDTVAGNINSELIVSQLPDNIFQCLPGVPPDSGAYVQDLTVIDSDCINATYVGRQLTLDIVVDPAVDNVLECRGNGLYSPLGGGINAIDTDCLSLNLVGGVLSGTILLAPTQGVIPNAATCIPGQGFYVPQAAGLSVTDTTCIDLTLTNGNLTADLVVSPSGDNQLVCGMGGVYVPPAAGLLANDTDCVNHTLVGGVLTTTLNFAGPQGGIPNILNCIPGQGLYVPESHLNVVDTSCINLTFAGGVLSADIIIDPTGDNQAQCLPAGLYVPPAAGLIANDTNCIALNLAGDTLTATPVLAPAQGGVPNALECLAQGLYVPESTVTALQVIDTDCINLTLVGNDLSADPIISPDICNGLECRANGLYVNNDILNIITDNQLPQQPLGILNIPDIGIGNWLELGNDIVHQITNTSLCNDMVVDVTVNGVSWGLVNETGTADAVVQAGFGLSIDGGPLLITTVHTATMATPLGFRQHIPAQSLSAPSVVLAPGATLTVRIQPVIRGENGTFQGNVSINGFNAQLQGLTFIN